MMKTTKTKKCDCHIKNMKIINIQKKFSLPSLSLFVFGEPHFAALTEIKLDFKRGSEHMFSYQVWSSFASDYSNTVINSLSK